MEEGGGTEVLEGSLSQYHFVHQKSHIDWPGFQSAPVR